MINKKSFSRMAANSSPITYINKKEDVVTFHLGMADGHDGPNSFLTTAIATMVAKV